MAQARAKPSTGLDPELAEIVKALARRQARIDHARAVAKQEQ